MEASSRKMISRFRWVCAKIDCNRSGKKRRWLKFGTTTLTNKSPSLLLGFESPSDWGIMRRLRVLFCIKRAKRPHCDFKTCHANPSRPKTIHKNKLDRYKRVMLPKPCYREKRRAVEGDDRLGHQAMGLTATTSNDPPHGRETPAAISRLSTRSSTRPSILAVREGCSSASACSREGDTLRRTHITGSNEVTKEVTRTHTSLLAFRRESSCGRV